MRSPSSLLISVLAAVTISVSAASVGPSSTLKISDATVSPDGFSRPGILVNHQFPGPIIRAEKNENFDLNVLNELSDPSMLIGTSIHWHGIFQQGTTWADGAEAVSQCPISPGRSFRYKFAGAQHAGTFWYHSHFGTQYCDGLRGPMVIYDPQDPHKSLYDVDNDQTVITLADWYNVTAPYITGPPRSHSTLINGKGRRIKGPQSELSVVRVQPFKRYRFRLVSLSCDPAYVFSIDGHKLKVIEADGQNTKPVEVDQLTIYAGQRYSIVVETNARTPANPGNFWIRAVPIPTPLHDTTAGAHFENNANSAILRYDGAPAIAPTTSPLSNPVELQETSLHPLDNENPAAPTDDPDNVIRIELDFGFSAGKFTLNGTTFTFPETPVLLQILSGKTRPEELLPNGLVFPLPRNKVIELVVPASAGLIGGPHPFHLHGHPFSVVRSAGSTETNLVNPVRRDVVNIGQPGDQVTIRFRTDNPGPWFFHCHIEFHLAAGLAVVFAEAIDDIAAENPVPTAWSELCDVWHSQNSAARLQLESGLARVAPNPAGESA